MSLTKMQLVVAVLMAAAVVVSVFWQGENNLRSAQERIDAGKMIYVAPVKIPDAE